MKTHLPILVVFNLALLLCSHASCRAQGANTLPADQKALATMVQEVDSAYDVQDAARFSALFSEDANFEYVIEGLTLHGREEIKQHFARQFATAPPMRHVTTTGTTDAITPGILVVDMQLDILAVDPATRLASSVLFHYNGLGIGIRTDQGWRIRLVRLYRMAK